MACTPKHHLITVEQMVDIAKAMDEAGIPLIEVTHGDGLGGASVNYGFPAATDEEYLSAVCREMKNAKVSALLLPGIGTVDHLKMAVDCGISTIRVATHCTEADVSEQHLKMATQIRWPGCGGFSDDGPHDQPGRASGAAQAVGGFRRQLRLYHRLCRLYAATTCHLSALHWPGRN